MKTLLALFLTYLAIHTYGQNTLPEIYKNGVKSGVYKSYYSNGQLKTKGKYNNNVRIGRWNIYDSLGEKVMTRDYGKRGALTVTILSGENKSVTTETAKSKNEDHYYSFPKVTPNDVLFSKRLWRELEPSKMNMPLFKDNELYEQLLNWIENKELKGYSPDSDEFKTLLDTSKIQSLRGKYVVKYKLKEDWYYDKASQRGELIIVGFCPVVLVDGKEKDAFWIYYPQARKQLAQVGLDDIFYFHQFNSTIVKESNLKNKRLDQYLLPTEIPNEILRIELMLIETEVNFWLKQVE